MYIETVGYIRTKIKNKDIINELIEKYTLSNMDCHEDEIITNVDNDFLKELLELRIVTKNDYNELMERCDVVKFYW